MKETSKLGQLKKKLFIVACYLLVALALLLYVTYSHYRMRIQAEVYMPETYAIEASMSLDPRLTTGESIMLNSAFLNELNPASDADAYAQNDNPHYRILLRVANADTTASEEVTIKDEVAWTYKLTIETSGRLPLEFVVYEDDESGTPEKYTAVAYNGTYSDSPLEYKFTNAEGEELQVALPAVAEPDGDIQVNVHKIYVGWDKTKQNTADYDPSVYENVEFRKEVDELKLRVSLVSDELEKVETVDSEGIVVYTD